MDKTCIFCERDVYALWAECVCFAYEVYVRKAWTSKFSLESITFFVKIPFLKFIVTSLKSIVRRLKSIVTLLEWMLFVPIMDYKVWAKVKAHSLISYRLLLKFSFGRKSFTLSRLINYCEPNVCCEINISCFLSPRT